MSKATSGPSTATVETKKPARQGALPPYLFQRGNTFYFKRKIPSELAHAFPQYKGQIWKSLGTDNLQKAKLLLAVEVTEFDLTVTRLKVQRAARAANLTPLRRPEEGTTKTLLEAHIPALLARYAHAHLSTDDEERRGMTAEERTERLQDWEQGLAMLRDAAASDDVSAIEETAEVILEAERLNAPPGSEVREQFLRQLLYKDIEILEQQRDRLLGKGVVTQIREPVAPRNLPTLMTLFQDWKKKQDRLRTIDAVEKVVVDFHDQHGALPVESLRAKDARDFRDKLIGRKLSAETIKNRIGYLATLVRHGKNELVEGMSGNPFENIEVIVEEDDDDEDKNRRAYEISELNKLYQSPLYTRGYRPSGQSVEASYWLPLLGPYVGGRIEEVCQLRLDDIECINSVWSLRICNLGKDQKLKNKNSFRRVPLHEELIKCGFLVYAAQQKAAGHEYLFPSLRNENKHEIFSNSPGKWFGRYLDSIGLSDPDLDYHGFRYTFRQQCTLCGIENEVRDALTGHWANKKDSGRTYMKAQQNQYPFPLLVKAIATLRYDELKLDHLYVADPYEGVKAAFGK